MVANTTIVCSHDCHKADTAWWEEFVVKWNVVSFLCPTHDLPIAEIASDASGE